MQNRNNYTRPLTSFPVLQKQTITVAQLENALSDTVSIDVQLPVLNRSSSVTTEQVNFNVDRKITHDKPFNEVWSFPQDIMKTIPTAVKYNVVATDMNYNSGRKKFVCSFYNKNLRRVRCEKKANRGICKTQERLTYAQVACECLRVSCYSSCFLRMLQQTNSTTPARAGLTGRCAPAPTATFSACHCPGRTGSEMYSY